MRKSITPQIVTIAVSLCLWGGLLYALPALDFHPVQAASQPIPGSIPAEGDFASLLPVIPAEREQFVADEKKDGDKKSEDKKAADNKKAEEKKEEKKPDPAADQTKPDLQRAREWMDSLKRRLGSRSVGPYEKNTSAVRSVFRPVVADIRQGTAIVTCNGKDVALGTVVDANGLILTKCSELDGDSLECKLFDGRKLQAEIVGTHKDTDLALLRVAASNLKAVKWSEAVPPVGNLLATSGLQEDPLAIGVVSVAPRKIRRPSGMMGVVLEDSDDGPRITEIMPNSSAARAGLQAKDTFRKLDGKDVKTRETLINSVRSRFEGDKLKITIRRDGKDIDMQVTLGNWPSGPPNDKDPFNRSDAQNWMGGALSIRRAGFDSVLQHDTMLRPNDCGGPLVDLDGNVIGINIARAGRVVSFALPAQLILSILPELKSGKLAPPRLVSADMARLEEVEKKLNELETEQKKLELARTVAVEILQKSKTDLEKAEAQMKRAEEALASLKAERAKLLAEKLDLEKKQTVPATTKPAGPKVETTGN